MEFQRQIFKKKQPISEEIHRNVWGKLLKNYPKKMAHLVGIFWANFALFWENDELVRNNRNRNTDYLYMEMLRFQT